MQKLTARATPCQLPGYPDYLASLLCARGITTSAQAADFLNPSAAQLYDPMLLGGMDKACVLIHEAAKKRQVVAVYGDYDADGVCASAIVIETLEALGIRAFSYIPARLTEGYGINAEAVTTLAGQAGLLISVDCGITAVEEVRLARSLGMTVILTDHHTLPDTLPSADAIVHPQLAEYPDPSLCGAGVAWKLSCALLGLERAMTGLDLAALATVADLVPLQGENRVIVSLGLKALQHTDRPGLRELMRVAGISEGAMVHSEHVAFQIAPRLNAGGRLATAQEALSLLLTREPERAVTLAARLDSLNRERREVEQLVQKEAAALLRNVDLSQRRSIVLYQPHWNPGVVGLAAGKLAERWNYPCIVLSKNGEELSGSGRSAGEIDLYDALKDCEGLLTRFGGHRMAAGLALKEDKLAEFIACFDKAVRAQLETGDLIPEIVYDTVLPLDKVTLETVGLLEQLAPFGLGNPSPVFLMEDVRFVSARAVGSNQAHLKLTVAREGAVREGIAFGHGKLADALGETMTLVSGVERNEFNGHVSVQLMVKAILPGQSPFFTNDGAQARAVCAAVPDDDYSDTRITADELDALPEKLHGTRGTLLVAYMAKTANDLHARYPYLQTYTGNAADPRSFNAIVFAPDWRKRFARYERVIFADGLPFDHTAGLAGRACGAGVVQALPQSAELKEMLRTLRPDLDGLRRAYRCLRDGKVTGFAAGVGEEVVALLVFEQLGLVELDEHGRFARLLPMQRVNPEHSSLYLALTK